MSQTVLGIASRVAHPTLGQGVVVAVHAAAYDVCFVNHGVRAVGKRYSEWEVVEAIAGADVAIWSEAERGLTRILRAYGGVTADVEIAAKFEGGTLELRPADPALKPKAVAIEDFFKKITAVRDRLRVLEQRVNASALPATEKANLQQYVTKAYGSLTSFNVLFADREEGFRGTGQK